MSAEVAFNLSPFAVLVGAALFVLLLEAAGTPVAARKVGPRGYFAFIVLAAVGLAALQVAANLPDALAHELVRFDALTRAGALVVLALLAVSATAAVPGLRRLDAERGEAYAALLFVAVGELAVVFADDLAMVTSGVLVTTVAGVGGLVVDRASGRGAEAAVKHVQANALVLVLLGLGGALVYLETGAADLDAVVRESGLGALLVTVALLEGLLVFPLHVARVDVLTGAPLFSGPLLIGARAVGATVVLARLVDAGLAGPARELLLPLAVISLVAPALVAADQREMTRAAAHLTAAHTALALPLLLCGPGGGASATLVVATAALAAFGSQALLARTHPSRESLSWEAFSGLGRRAPVLGLALVALLGVSAFVPLLPGLPQRLGALTAAVADDQVLLAFALAVGGALVLVTPLRLALFLFAKAVDPRAARVVVDVLTWVVVVVVAALLLACALVPARVTALLIGGP